MVPATAPPRAPCTAHRLHTHAGVARWTPVAHGGLCDLVVNGATEEICLQPYVGPAGAGAVAAVADLLDATLEPPVTLTLRTVHAQWRIVFAVPADAASWAAWATAAVGARDWVAAASALAAAGLPLADGGRAPVVLAVHASLVGAGANAALAPQAYPVPTAHGAVSATAPAWRDVYRALRLLATALRQYAPPLWAATTVARVAIAGSVAFAGEPRQAMPDFGSGTLHVGAESATLDANYFVRMVHHELFHFLDYAYSPRSLYDDPAFATLNAPGVGYRSAEADGPGPPLLEAVRTAWELEPAVVPRAPLPPGMISSYAAASVAEDKAEVFAYLMMDAAAVDALCRADAALARKRDAIAARVQQLAGAAPAGWQPASTISADNAAGQPTSASAPHGTILLC